jgi:hypothetical protein
MSPTPPQSAAPWTRSTRWPPRGRRWLGCNPAARTRAPLAGLARSRHAGVPSDARTMVENRLARNRRVGGAQGSSSSSSTGCISCSAFSALIMDTRSRRQLRPSQHCAKTAPGRLSCKVPMVSGDLLSRTPSDRVHFRSTLGPGRDVRSATLASTGGRVADLRGLPNRSPFL